MPDTLPPAFDPPAYRHHNAALADLSPDELRAHYEEQGRKAGLVASPLALREGLLAIAGDGRTVLEIGPFCAPLLRGPQVEYLDVLDADQLRARAIKIGIDPSGCPPHIHHVGDIAQIGRRYDAVISSHAIEHQPDLVRHLREVERILEPDGSFLLIIPDKRYCFDHFLPESSIAQIIAAYAEGRRVHTLASIVEHMALTTHNDSTRHWAGDHGDPAKGRAARIRAALDRHEAADGGYVDVHAWQFTPSSFREAIDMLAALGLIGLEVGEVYDTVRGRNEFCAVLRPGAAARHAKHALALGITPAEASDPAPPAGPASIEQPALIEPRWLGRLHHPIGQRPPLAEAPPVPPLRPDLTARIIAAWRIARAGDESPLSSTEEGLAAALDRGDEGVGAMLAGMGREPFTQGYLGGARQHHRARDTGFAARLALETWDRLVSLGEAVGALAIENPEGGPWDENAHLAPDRIFTAIEQAVGRDLAPPRHIGGYLGIAIRDGMIVHMRMLDAIHAACRLRELAAAHDLARPRVIEFGGGVGLAAHYANRLGIKDYLLVARSVMSAVQAALLGDEEAVTLPGEPLRTGGIRLLTPFLLDALPGDSADILFDQDMLPALPRADAITILRRARELGVRMIVSINPDAAIAPGGLPQQPVRELVAAVGGWRLAGRHRHWLRAGHVEEMWIAG